MQIPRDRLFDSTVAQTAVAVMLLSDDNEDLFCNSDENVIVDGIRNRILARTCVVVGRDKKFVDN